MSEQRFKKMDTIIDPFPIWDTVEEKGYNCTDTLDLLVDLLNTLHQENQELKKKNNALKEDINQSEKRVKHWMILYGDVYDKMQKRRASG